MGHCVKHGGYDRDCIIFSLRDGAGGSHVTAEYAVQDGRLHLVQYVGQRNRVQMSHFEHAALRRLDRRIGAWIPGHSIP